MKYIIITRQLYLGFPFFSTLFDWDELIWVLLEKSLPSAQGEMMNVLSQPS